MNSDNSDSLQTIWYHEVITLFKDIIVFKDIENICLRSIRRKEEGYRGRCFAAQVLFTADAICLTNTC